jgi:hypothetical protein
MQCNLKVRLLLGPLCFSKIVLPEKAFLWLLKIISPTEKCNHIVHTSSYYFKKGLGFAKEQTIWSLILSIILLVMFSPTIIKDPKRFKRQEVTLSW